MLEIFRQLWPYVWRYKRTLALGFGALILKDLLVVSQPLLIKTAIDRLMSGFSLRTVFTFAAALAGVTAAKGVFQYVMRVRLVGLSRDIEYDLRNDLFAHMVTLDQAFYGRYRTGDLLARATSDLNAVRMMMGPGIMYWFETMLTFILAVVVMLSVDWRITLIALSPAPLVSIAVIFFGKRIHERFEQIQARFADISSRVQENLAGVRVVRAYVQEQAELKLFDSLNRDFVTQNLGLARLSGLFQPILQFLIGLTFLMVLLAGGWALLEKRITLGSFVMFNTYMGMLIWPLIAFGWVVNLIQRGTASFRRIRELIERKPAIAAATDAVALPRPFRASIEFRGVTLRYDSRAVLRDLNLTIAPGQTVAIVGHTGSGKTSLVHLIPRLMDPTEGAVLVSGADLRRLDPADLRRQIGFVPQETFLFSSSIAENIAFGVPGASREQVREAAEIAGLGPDIESFPKGLDTAIGERGITLSGGQKQRTAIARAILRSPAILILDDALSSVDTVTEERILTALAEARRQATTILISHRVSTVRAADCIYVIEDGSIIERGTHGELVALGGTYAELHERQLLEEELEAI